MDYQSLQPVARRLIVLAASSLRLLIALVSLLLVFTASARTYTVKSGDTLQRIAQRELGSANRWPEIARANNLPPPHTIRLGQQLNLPDNQSGMIPLAPQASVPLATNSSTHPLPIVPPGNTISTNSPNVTSTPLTDDQPSLSDFSNLLWAIPLGLLFFLLFQALNLRISCWFSLVETTYLRCLKLALYLLLLAIASGFAMLMIFLLGAALRNSGEFAPWRVEAIFMIAPYSLPVWFVLSLVVIKRTLECKWRSVVTLLIMSMFVTWMLGAIILFSTMSIGPIIELLVKLPKP